jgi:hypothetical protein
MDLDVHELAQFPDEELHVNSRAAVHVWWVFTC